MATINLAKNIPKLRRRASLRIESVFRDLDHKTHLADPELSYPSHDHLQFISKEAAEASQTPGVSSMPEAELKSRFPILCADIEGRGLAVTGARVLSTAGTVTNDLDTVWNRRRNLWAHRRWGHRRCKTAGSPDEADQIVEDTISDMLEEGP